jgi:hypothetical protein
MADLTSGKVRLRQNNNQIEVSVDSGATWAAVGAGLSAIADQTFLGNISGGAAVPIGLPVAQMLTALGLSAISDNRATALIRAQALCGSTLNSIVGTDFGENATYVAAVASGGTAALSAVDKGGVVLVKSNGTASGQAVVKMTGAPPIVDNAKTSRWYAVWRAKFATAGDGASQMDFQLNPASGNTIMDFGQAGGLSSTLWRVRIVDGSGASLFNATVVTAIDTSYHTIEIYNDGTNVSFALDAAVLKAQLVSSFASGDPIVPSIFTNCGASATNREIDCDYMYFVSPSN